MRFFWSVISSFLSYFKTASIVSVSYIFLILITVLLPRPAFASSVSSDEYQDRYLIGLSVGNNILLARDIGTNNLAEWVSNNNYSLEGQYQFLYKNFWLGASLSYHFQSYEVEQSPTYTWDEETPDQLKISLVSDYEKDGWGLGFDLNYHETSFVYENNFDVRLRDVFMLGVSFRSKYKWLDRNQWSSRFGLTVDLPFTGSDLISPKGRLGYVAFVDLRRDDVIRDFSLGVKLYYGFRNYENDQNKQEEELIGLLFTLISKNWL